MGANMLVHRMSLAKKLWDAGIPAQYLPQENAKLNKQLQYALEEAIPFMVIVGESELEKGVVQVSECLSSLDVGIQSADCLVPLLDRSKHWRPRWSRWYLWGRWCPVW